MLDEAELRAEVASRRETLGDTHPDTLSTIGNMGALLQSKGKLAGRSRCFVRHWLGVETRWGTSIPIR